MASGIAGHVISTELMFDTPHVRFGAMAGSTTKSNVAKESQPPEPVVVKMYEPELK
jgi:hypothetical protein